MNIDLSSMPATIDILHLGFAALVILLFVLLLLKGRGGAEHHNSTASQLSVSAPEPKPVVELKETAPDAALQLLSLLQQDARFVDFVYEDLAGFSDEEIGAVARVVHEGSKKVFDEYLTMAPVRDELEESSVTLQQGFNASEVRLVGNVVGEAPFTGTLVHRGWKVADVKLPKLAQGHDAHIVAPAEVEL